MRVNCAAWQGPRLYPAQGEDHSSLWVGPAVRTVLQKDPPGQEVRRAEQRGLAGGRVTREQADVFKGGSPTPLHPHAKAGRSWTGGQRGLALEPH